MKNQVYHLGDCVGEETAEVITVNGLLLVPFVFLDHFPHQHCCIRRNEAGQDLYVSLKANNTMT